MAALTVRRSRYFFRVKDYAKTMCYPGRRIAYEEGERDFTVSKILYARTFLKNARL